MKTTGTTIHGWSVWTDSTDALVALVSTIEKNAFGSGVTDGQAAAKMSELATCLGFMKSELEDRGYIRYDDPIYKERGYNNKTGLLDQLLKLDNAFQRGKAKSVVRKIKRRIAETQSVYESRFPSLSSLNESTETVLSLCTLAFDTVEQACSGEGPLSLSQIDALLNVGSVLDAVSNQKRCWPNRLVQHGTTPPDSQLRSISGYVKDVAGFLTSGSVPRERLVEGMHYSMQSMGVAVQGALYNVAMPLYRIRNISEQTAAGIAETIGSKAKTVVMGPSSESVVPRDWLEGDSVELFDNILDSAVKLNSIGAEDQ